MFVHPVALALALGLLLGTILLLALRPFERTVAFRYLSRARPARRARAALIVSLLGGAVGAALLLLTRGFWLAELAGAALLFVAAVGVLASVLSFKMSAFTTISTLGLSLGVAALVVVLAVTSGFQRDFLTRISAFHAHLVVGLYGEPTMADARKEIAELDRKLRDLPGVVRSGPFATTVFEVMIGGSAANLRAVDATGGSTALDRWMIEGSTADLGREALCPDGDTMKTAGPIVLGDELARKTRAKVGTCIDVLVPVKRAGGFELDTLSFKVVGRYRMGFNLYDRSLAYISLDDVGRIESARPFIYGLALEWTDPFAALKAEPAIVARVGPDYSVLDWRLLGRGLFDTLATQRVMIGFFLCIIILVSAFNLLASLFLIVISKTREIAILSTMGARPGAVIRVFVTAGGLSGLIGTAGGMALGLFVCGLLSLYRYPLDVATYQVGELPVSIVPAELILIAGVALAACLLATIPAVRRARRLQVVDGLREV
jgi:lipoprotein-releasing system permease protein